MCTVTKYMGTHIQTVLQMGQIHADITLIKSLAARTGTSAGECI